MMVRTKTMFVHNPWGKKRLQKIHQSQEVSLYCKSLHFKPSAIHRIFFVLAEENQDPSWKKFSYLINLSWESVVHLLNMWEPEGAGRFSGWEEDLSLKGEHCPEDGVRTWDISTRKEKSWNICENKGFRRIGKIKKRRKSEKCNCGGDDEE